MEQVKTSLHDKIISFLQKYGFVRAEWDHELTCFTDSGEPFGASEFVHEEISKEWYLLEEEIQQFYGRRPHALRLEWEIDSA